MTSPDVENQIEYFGKKLHSVTRRKVGDITREYFTIARRILQERRKRGDEDPIKSKEITDSVKE